MSDLRSYIRVPEGYAFSFEDKVYSLMKKEFKTSLDAFLKTHAILQQKENYPFLPERLRADFPFVEYKPFKDELFTRRQDPKFLEKLLQPYFDNNKTALEIGGWNGWLTRFLCSKKISVITADIFSDENNGLRSRKFHKDPTWLSLQTDVCNPSVYQKKFDAIVFNHCLHFYPEDTLPKYLDLLNPGGMLVILGVTISGNETKERQKAGKGRSYLFKKYGIDLNFYEGPRYYNQALKNLLKPFTFISYSFSWKSRIKNLALGKKHGIYYFVKQKNNNKETK